MNTVRVQLGERSYDIVVTHDDPAGLAPFARQRAAGNLACIVTDQHVVPQATAARVALAGAGFQTMMVTLQPGEAHKSLATASLIYDGLAEALADRKTLVVAVGGGVVGDVAGFVAATYNRGLPLLMVPTTLLAMVDSSVGGKVGVNHPRAKNLIGAFHQPVGVWIDTAALATLPDREYRSGLAEVVKYGVILDAEFFAWLEPHADALLKREAEAVGHVVARSCRLKADVVEHDEFERTGLRAVLNYGHTFAHAFEALGGYGELLHGEAVSIGMVYAARLAQRLNRIDAATVERQSRLLTALGLPIALPDTVHLSTRDILDSMRLDKKTVGGHLRFVLPTRLGHVELVDEVAEDDVCAVLDSVASQSKSV
jgi:3-dehydroquinate synthase